MRVFISWSGPTSRCVAEALRNWLPRVMQTVEPFTSTEIDKGAQWATVVSQQLQRAHVGIVCLTPENLQSRWLHYEAGALATAVGTAQAPEVSRELAVWTYLYNLEYSAVEYPLAQFQHTLATREDTLGLLRSINRTAARYGEKPLSSEILDDAFDQWWPQLEIAFSRCGAVQLNSDVQPRSEREMLAEVLGLVRELRSAPRSTGENEALATPQRPAEDARVGLNRVPVRSTNIITAGYDPERQILEVQFQNGAVYEYFDVPEEQFREFLDAPSAGVYFSDWIKAKHRFVRRH